MQASLNAMQTAMRVLSAITERRAPAPADVEELRNLSEGKAKDLPLDELACEVIQVAIRHREQARRMAAERGGNAGGPAE